MTARSAGEAMRTAQISAVGQASCRVHPHGPETAGNPSADPAMVVLVLAQDPPQMGLMPDEGSVQEFAAAPADPADHELDPISLFAEVHEEEVAGLLGGPLPGGMQCDADDADAPGGVLDHDQDIDLGAVEQAGPGSHQPRIAGYRSGVPRPPGSWCTYRRARLPPVCSTCSGSRDELEAAGPDRPGPV